MHPSAELDHKTETATCMRGRIGSIVDWAEHRGIAKRQESHRVWNKFDVGGVITRLPCLL